MCSTAVLQQLETRLDALISNQKLILRAFLGRGDVHGTWKINSVEETIVKGEKYTDWGAENQFLLSKIRIEEKSVTAYFDGQDQREFSLEKKSTYTAYFSLAENGLAAEPGMIFRTALLITIHDGGDLRKVSIICEKGIRGTPLKMCIERNYGFINQE